MPTSPADPVAVDDLDDGALALRAQGGDHRAFSVLMRRHEAALRRTVLARTRHPADADDAVQEAVVKVWRNLHALREPAKVRAWIMAIAAREALQVVTARRPEVELFETVALVTGPERSIERLDLQDGLRAVLQRMPQQQAHAWVLRELDGLSYRDIAIRLDLPESSVRGSLVLARRRVQTAIDGVCPSARPPADYGTAGIESIAAPLTPPVKAPVAIHPPSSPTLGPRAEVRTALHEDLDLEETPAIAARSAVRV